jgi:hypothetical protein
MLMKLTRLKRVRAGWIVAVIYLLCVLAPTISFAMPGSKAIAPCLTDANHVPGTVHLHNEAPTPHIHQDGYGHDHSGTHSHVRPDSDHRSISMALNAKPVPEKAPHSSGQQCCGLMCITALPAQLANIMKPAVPTAVCEFERSRKAIDNAPPRLYRPPIS